VKVRGHDRLHAPAIDPVLTQLIDDRVARAHVHPEDAGARTPDDSRGIRAGLLAPSAVDEDHVAVVADENADRVAQAAKERRQEARRIYGDGRDAKLPGRQEEEIAHPYIVGRARRDENRGLERTFFERNSWERIRG